MLSIVDSMAKMFSVIFLRNVVVSSVLDFAMIVNQ